MSIGIIGAAGFLGSYLREALDRDGKRYKAFDKNVSVAGIQYLDVTSCSESSALNGCNVVINLAAEHRDDIFPVSRYDEVNVDGARQVCNLASSSGVNKIIFTSSVAIYGFAPPDTDETGEVNYYNHYGRTKFEAEGIYRAWQQEDPDARSLVIVRPTVIFGPGNRGNVYNLLNQIAKRQFIMFGDGNNAKSMAYVDNVAEFLMYCLAAPQGVHVYNYIDKPDLTMNDLVKITRATLFNKKGVGLRLPAFVGVAIGKVFDFLAGFTGKSFPVSGIRVKKFLATTKFNSAVYETCFSPRFTLKEGLERTLRYEFLESNKGRPIFYTE